MPAVSLILLCVGQCVAMLISLEIGFRVGRRHYRNSTQGELSVIEAAIFALFGLLLGFAFSGAMSRLDTRKDLIVQEANAIGTAYLRIDLLPKDDQPEMRKIFHAYLEARLHVFDALDARQDVAPAIAEAAALQRKIWDFGVEINLRDGALETSRDVLPAINEMIDVTTARAVAQHTKTPTLILVLLLSIALLSALLAGSAMAKRERRSYFHALLFAITVSLTIYTVLDLDDPRHGLIRLNAAEEVLRQLKATI